MSSTWRRDRARRRWLASAFGALAVAGALLPATGAAGAATSDRAPSYIAAAEYFGDGNPTNLWSSDLSGAPATFAQMKQDGFNTVGLILPWGEFQPGVVPPRFDQQAFGRLDRLIADARELGMGVILRLSYEWDVDPSDQLPGLERFEALFSNQSVYSAWLDYIAAVHRNVARYDNVREAYISWEDLWAPIDVAQGAATPAEQLAAARTTGYLGWLRGNESLAEVSGAYGTTFTSWTQVPTPPADAPSFKLMYRYEDWALVHRLFLPAARRYPGLTMETRVDVDPLYDGTQVVGSYSHRAQFTLPGTSVTGMYFSPYMEDPSPTPVETATEATTALHSVLARMSAAAGDRKLFIYEYEIESNSPIVSDDPALTPAQIPAFVAASEPFLHRYTTGYALWTYHDYHQSPLYNQSFALGSAGWHLTSGAKAVPHTTSMSYLMLRAGAGATQAVPAATVNGATPATVTLQTDATSPTTLDVSRGGGAAQVVQVAPGWHDYQVTFPPSATGSLSLRAGGALSVSDVQMFWFTQYGDVYSADGGPEVGVGPLRTVNQELTSAG